MYILWGHCGKMRLYEYLDLHAPPNSSIQELHTFAQKYFLNIRHTVIPEYKTKWKYWKYIILDLLITSFTCYQVYSIITRCVISL